MQNQSIGFLSRRRFCLAGFASIPLVLSLFFFMNFFNVSKTWIGPQYPQYLSAYFLSNESLPALVVRHSYRGVTSMLFGEQQDSEVWYTSKDKLDNLMSNPVYRKFNISRMRNREHVNLLLFVSTAPKRIDRRDATRMTWWQQCKSTNKISVLCYFITDHVDPSTKQGAALAAEQAKHGDLLFQRLTSGTEFGKRYLYHLVLAMQRYKFDYFIRMDDDMFFCFDRFLHELPLPPLKFFHWGWVHCLANIVRPEESIIMLTRDVVEQLLGQHPDMIMCHPFADQMIGAWSEELKLDRFYHHDPRVHHDPPADFIPTFKTKTNICHTYMAVHGSYPNLMKTLWEHRGPPSYPSGSLTDHAHVCKVPHHYDWKLFATLWRFEPKRCISNPSWDMSGHGAPGKSYSGREGT